MLVLGVDTSWKNGNIALVRDGEVLGTSQLEGGTFSAQLVPQIARLLSEHRSTKKDVSGFSVVSGPGSFTGLRVGLAAVKALAEVLEVPIAATTVLEAMALQRGTEGRSAAALDAGRGELYLGEYDVRRDGRVRASVLRQLVLPRADAAIALRSSTVLCCEPSSCEALRESGVEVLEVPRPDSALIARIGAEKIAAGQTITPEQLDADYIRRSDAEIFSVPRP